MTPPVTDLRDNGQNGSPVVPGARLPDFPLTYRTEYACGD